jgi:carbon monoxide dehydrogenase subunit G
VTLPTPTDDAPFSSSKRDKRTIKHSAFVGKIEKSSSKIQKRRRPNKKLVTNLESLADALSGLKESDGKGEVVVGQAKIQRKSLKSRPGAMKKKEKLEKLEKERFNMNLAQMATSSAASSAAGGIPSVDRWAALKNHVKNTAEIKPEFLQK